MKATIYHNPNCSTSRKTLDILREAGCDVTVVDYLKTPLDEAGLRAIYDRAGLRPSEGLRAKEPLATELGLTDGRKSEDEILAAIAAHPILMNRPLVVTDKGAALCRPQDTVRALL